MLWNIYTVDATFATHRRLTKLGRVRAAHQPAALLRAVKKFGITKNSAMHALSAVPVRNERGLCDNPELMEIEL